MIEISHASKAYGDTIVVRDVSLTLPRRGVTSIIGPNGAGKSTLLSMVGRLLPMSAGTVTIDGLDITRTPSDILARRLSILRQDNRINARLTVRDLVEFGRYPYSKGRLTPDDRSQADKAIGFLGLEPLAERFLDELSGGQRQRAYVAMVLCQDTDYVLFDEPLNNLDMKHAVGMMKLLRRAADDLGKTIVVVLHDINFASCYSDYIVAMRDGAIVRHGTPDETMTASVIRDVYDMDVTIQDMEGRKIALYYV
ncbi:iron ABC transporter ATP-binding protein [Microvirga lotononidis]|uniref:ABC-type enterochelin transport system, ATPase component n=1 Tax=Microvirga lotononidis TaxID=864069 RepID=I4YU40_9HYPH|nr:ABC transporter ATP-binding protein [Microvirga lotononidis]EIM27482.1 ABC-type enterochelin transport system, ATPase component [Microvirga lotononidis]WQO28364.1 ABC transporter ATP-binding protein [Microvirga lotononidis]